MQFQVAPVTRATRVHRLIPAAAIALALLVPMAPIPGATGATSAARVPVSSAAAAAPASPAIVEAARVSLAGERRRRYTPRTGVIVTNPLNADSRRRIMNHIVKSIRATRRGHKIRIISWNVVSRQFVRALINAHDRGVSVRLLMSSAKAAEQSRGGSFWSLRRNLRDRNGQPRRNRSWARGCERTCRGGNRGIAHSKLFLFSKAGRADYVVMSTSANATEVAVLRQWNDLYTHTENRMLYRGFYEVFQEAARDRRVRHAFRTFQAAHVTGYVYPFRGRHANGDRVKNELRRITCRGAAGGTGIAGRTRIRIAQDAIINQRGIEIAHILRNKFEAGCKLRIVYALMGGEVRRILTHTSRGAVPIRQIVQDWDCDGVYDRYLHSKVMAVSGWYRKDRSSLVSWQGSENWSGLATISDEQGFQIRRRGAEGTYTRWINWLFKNPPPRENCDPNTLRIARARGVDPYALIKEELGLPARPVGSS